MAEPTDTDANRVTIKIDNKRFDYWSEVEIQLALDSFSTITFTAPFESERKEFRDTFRPFSYKPLTVHVNDELLFTGTLVGVEPKLEADARTVVCSGYALPAVLEDSAAPTSVYPLEFRGLTLRQILETIAQAFILDIDAPIDLGPVFDKVAIDPSQTLIDFLSDLARKRGFVINDNPQGAIRFLTSIGSGSSRANFKKNEPPLTSVAVTFSPQDYYSEITGIAKTKAGQTGSRYTVFNSKLTRELRAHTFQADDINVGDLPAAVFAKVGRMFGSVVSYVVEVPTWRDEFGDLWEPNSFVTLEAPDVMVYSKTQLLTRNIILRQDASGFSASLGLVLPGIFSGEIPPFLPWEDN